MRWLLLLVLVITACPLPPRPVQIELLLCQYEREMVCAVEGDQMVCRSVVTDRLLCVDE